MKNILLGIISIAFLLSFISCADEADPKFRVMNERENKTNLQIQTSGGNTININDVVAGQPTAYQSAASGNITATAVIQNESVSPTITFYASKDTRYTIVVQISDPPKLRVDRD
ncbi:MAG: hypothetical protein Q8N83_17100 [Ignavibacteria bacterium]|nr:hypothetical protein [Ignavibacteria bacterium]